MSDAPLALAALKHARSIIADPRRWTRRALARTAGGEATYAEDFAATSWCSVGVLQLVRPLHSDPAIGMAAAYLTSFSGVGIATFNDRHTHGEVIRIWDKVIDGLEGVP